VIEIYFDGRVMLDKNTIHSEIKNKLNLPDYYGNNLDALWDCLTSWVDTPVHIVWQYSAITEGANREYFKEVVSLLKEAEIEGLVVLTFN